MGAEIPVEASRNDVLTAAATHATDAMLFAVAEGEAARQPDEATLGHIFGCPRCSATVREMRAGLAAFAVVARPAAQPQPVGAGLPNVAAAPRAAAEAATQLAASASDLATSGEDGSSRRMIFKLAAVGILLAAALWWMRSLADGLR